MVLAVVLDVPPVEAAASARALATCNAALGPQQCALADSTSSSGSTSHWYAVVRYDPDGHASLTIELHEGNRDGSRVANSELEFKERDPPEERWASVGVVVAALVLAQPVVQKRDQHEAAASVATTEPATVRVPSPPAAAGSPWLRLDLGISAGSEVRDAALRAGPLARFGIAFSSLPVFALSSLAYTLGSSPSTELTWLTGSVGAGVRLELARKRAALEARAEAVLETVGIRATDGVRTESARRTRFGPRLGLDLSGYWSRNWALVVGAEAGALSPRVVLDVGGAAQTEELPPFVWGLLSAVRYDFR